ncbi:PAS domain-containing protein [Polyangium sp. 15x6]|uniref:PAS domain-containing protein n=1 Tax=Polyangium sp. 15x6 TaxID=3042687 RepID=UPI00249A1197|nr:PAS domain-containing protein [Polyangium sp. 15x6]MDI3289035.1 PAS domain-containing protein [Polyangium sp. 15x6]
MAWGEQDEGALEREVEALRARLAEVEAELASARASEAELRDMFTAMMDVVLVLDAEGRYRKIVPTRPDLLYRPSDELLGKRLVDVLPMALASEFMAGIRTSLAEKKLVTTEYSMQLEGRDVFFSAHISPMSDGEVMFVARDVSDRKRAEEAVAEAIRKQAVIEAQAAALAALSTPLIPITDEIMVLPLIGILDAQRMQQVMDALLSGVTERGARTVILDITGIAVVDAQVADALVQVARAVQLVGADVVFTGIRRDVAQALVDIQANLGGVVTRSTVQSGIAFAMARRR